MKKYEDFKTISVNVRDILFSQSTDCVFAEFL
jgi:hypothetical protein